jgi:hypothetical protein
MLFSSYKSIFIFLPIVMLAFAVGRPHSARAAVVAPAIALRYLEVRLCVCANDILGDRLVVQGVDLEQPVAGHDGVLVVVGCVRSITARQRIALFANPSSTKSFKRSSPTTVESVTSAPAVRKRWATMPAPPIYSICLSNRTLMVWPPIMLVWVKPAARGPVRSAGSRRTHDRPG